MMVVLLGFRQLSIEKRIVQEFGDGTFRGDRSLFDQIRLPNGWSERRVSPSQLVEIVRQSGRAIVLFDRDPDNIRLSMEFLQKRGLPLTTIIEVESDDLAVLLGCDKCDMYVTTLNGDLLAIPCHEDPEVDGVRQIWVPVPPEGNKNGDITHSGS